MLQSEGVPLDHENLQPKAEPDEDRGHTHHSSLSPSIDQVQVGSHSHSHPDDSVEWWRQSECSSTADHPDFGGFVSHQRTHSAGSSGTALQSIPVTPGKDVGHENRVTHSRSSGYQEWYRQDEDRVARSVLSSPPANDADGDATVHEHGFPDTRSASYSSTMDRADTTHDLASYPPRFEVDLKPDIPQHDTLPHVVTLPELRHHAEVERYLPFNNPGAEPAPRAYPSTSPFPDDPDYYYQHQHHYQHHHRQQDQRHEDHQFQPLQPLHPSSVLPPIDTSYDPHVHEPFQPTARPGAHGAHGAHGSSAYRYPDHITFWETTIPSPPAPAPLSAGLAQYHLTRPQH